MAASMRTFAGPESKASTAAVPCGERGKVGDAAEILQDAVVRGVGEERAVEDGDERCSLAAGGHVCGTKVADDGVTGARGDLCRFPDLPGAAQRLAEVLLRGVAWWKMVWPCTPLSCALRPNCCCAARIALPYCCPRWVCRRASSAVRDGGGVHGGEHGGAGGALVGEGCVGEQLDLRLVRVAWPARCGRGRRRCRLPRCRS